MPSPLRVLLCGWCGAALRDPGRTDAVLPVVLLCQACGKWHLDCPRCDAITLARVIQHFEQAMPPWPQCLACGWSPGWALYDDLVWRTVSPRDHDRLVCGACGMASMRDYQSPRGNTRGRRCLDCLRGRCPSCLSSVTFSFHPDPYRSHPAFAAPPRQSPGEARHSDPLWMHPVFPSEEDDRVWREGGDPNYIPDGTHPGSRWRRGSLVCPVCGWRTVAWDHQLGRPGNPEGPRCARCGRPVLEFERADHPHHPRFVFGRLCRRCGVTGLCPNCRSERFARRRTWLRARWQCADCGWSPDTHRH
jgi:hypothetical protein